MNIFYDVLGLNFLPFNQYFYKNHFIFFGQTFRQYYDEEDFVSEYIALIIDTHKLNIDGLYDSYCFSANRNSLLRLRAKYFFTDQSKLLQKPRKTELSHEFLETLLKSLYGEIDEIYEWVPTGKDLTRKRLEASKAFKNKDWIAIYSQIRRQNIIEARKVFRKILLNLDHTNRRYNTLLTRRSEILLSYYSYFLVDFKNQNKDFDSLYLEFENDITIIEENRLEEEYRKKSDSDYRWSESAPIRDEIDPRDRDF